MTQGNILDHIIRFALPLLLGNLFHQLYNMVDTWVVVNYVSNEAYTAVGNVGMTLSMGVIFTGFGIFMIPYMLDLMNIPHSLGLRLPHI